MSDAAPTHDYGWTCTDCRRRVFLARVWDDRVECYDCWSTALLARYVTGDQAQTSALRERLAPWVTR